MATQQSLFERYGIKTPEQIRAQREADMLKFSSQLDGMGQVGYGIGRGLRSLFSGPDTEVQKAQKSSDMLAAIEAIPAENMTPELEQYYTSQLAAISPDLADQYQQDLTATRAAMLKASREQFGTTKVTVPTYGYDSKTKERYQTGTRSIDVPAKFVEGKGWVPIDAQYATSGAGDTEDLAVKFESNWYNNTNNQLADWKKGTPSTSTVGGGLGNVDLMSKNAGTGSVDPMTGRTVAGTSELSGLDAAVQKEMVGAYANYVAQANASGQMPIGMEEWLKANYK